MAELGGEPDATVIGLDDAAARRERRIRERDAVPRARLRRHALRLGQPRLDGDRARRRWPRRERLGASGRDGSRRSSPGTRSYAASAWRLRAPFTRAASTRPRSAGCSAASRRSRASQDSTRTRRRARWGSPGRSPAVSSPTSTRHADEADAPGLGGPRRAPRDPARGARRGRARSRARGEVRPLPRLPRRGARAIDIDGQLADLGSEVGDARIAYKPYPVCHFMHGSLGAAEAVGGRPSRPTRSTTSLVTVPEAGVSLVLEPATEKRGPARSTRGSSRCSTRSPRCSSAGRSTSSDYTDEAIRDPACSPSPGKVRYETEEFATYPQAFPGGVGVRLTDGAELEAELPYQRGGPENRSRGRGQTKFRGNAGLALRAEGGDRARGGHAGDRGAATSCPLGAGAARVARSRARLTRPKDPHLPPHPEQREIVSAVREFVDRDMIPVASRSSTATSTRVAGRDDAEMGFFGTTIPVEYGGLGSVSTPTR